MSIFPPHPRRPPVNSTDPTASMRGLRHTAGGGLPLRLLPRKSANLWSKRQNSTKGNSPPLLPRTANARLRIMRRGGGWALKIYWLCHRRQILWAFQDHAKTSVGTRKNIRAFQGQPKTKRALQGQTGSTQQLGSLSECSLSISPPYPWRPPVNSTNRRQHTWLTPHCRRRTTVTSPLPKLG